MNTILHKIYTWQARIHIGRWDETNLWRSAIEAKALEWKEHFPSISWSSASCDTKAIQTIRLWQIGGLLMGLDNLSAKDFLAKHPYILDQDIPKTELAFLAYALKTKDALSHDTEEKIRGLFKEYLSSGTVPYRDSCQEVRFVDTIGLLCPFLYATGMDELADRQIEEYDQALYDGIFPFHAFSLSTQLPMGVCDWSRGTGWYILGLIESGKHEDRILRLAEHLLPLQKQDGSFGCFLFNPFSRSESSGTASAGLLFVRAFQLSGNSAFLESALKTEQALIRATRRDGSIDYSQGDTEGIGIYSQHFDTLPFTQGIALLLANRLSSLSL